MLCPRMARAQPAWCEIGGRRGRARTRELQDTHWASNLRIVLDEFYSCPNWLNTLCKGKQEGGRGICRPNYLKIVECANLREVANVLAVLPHLSSDLCRGSPIEYPDEHTCIKRRQT